MVQMIGDVGALKTFQKYLLQNGFGVVLLEEYENLLGEIEKEEKFYLEKIEESKTASIHELKESERILEKDIKNLENELNGKENEDTSLILWVKELHNKFQMKKNITTKKNLLNKIRKEIEGYERGFFIIPQDLRDDYRRTANRKNTLSGCKNFYYGALGELKVKKVLERVQIDSVIINDFNVEIEKGISMKGGNDWIYSLQIDHIVVNERGIFLIETKNRSNETKNNPTFSPTYQTKRHGHGFYWYFKERFSKLIGRSPKIYNVLVMEGNKVENEEKGVYILNLGELNRFILTRTNNLSKPEVEKIKELLLTKNNR